MPFPPLKVKPLPSHELVIQSSLSFSERKSELRETWISTPVPTWLFHDIVGVVSAFSAREFSIITSPSAGAEMAMEPLVGEPMVYVAVNEGRFAEVGCSLLARVNIPLPVIEIMTSRKLGEVELMACCANAVTLSVTEVDVEEMAVLGSQLPRSASPCAPPFCQVVLCVLLTQVVFPSSKTSSSIAT